MCMVVIWVVLSCFMYVCVCIVCTTEIPAQSEALLDMMVKRAT